MCDRLRLGRCSFKVLDIWIASTFMPKLGTSQTPRFGLVAFHAPSSVVVLAKHQSNTVKA